MYNLLIIEDNINLASLMASNLSYDGYKVEIVHDSFEALNKVQKKSYDLITLDWKSPQINGLKICKEIKKKYPEIIVIMVTANKNIIHKIQGFESGVDDYLTKPFDSIELSVRIKAHLKNTN